MDKQRSLEDSVRDWKEEAKSDWQEAKETSPEVVGSLDDIGRKLWNKYSNSYLWNVNVNNILPRLPGVVVSGFAAYKMQQQGIDPVVIAATAPFFMRAVGLPVATALNYYWGRRKNKEKTGSVSNKQVVKYLLNVGGIGTAVSFSWALTEGAVAYGLTHLLGMPLHITLPTTQATGLAIKRTVFSYIAHNTGAFNHLENRSILDSKLGRLILGKRKKRLECSQTIFDEGQNGSYSVKPTTRI